MAIYLTNVAKLEKPFYMQNTEAVARQLLGKILVHKVNGKYLAGRITETEAYLGIIDKACHTFDNRRTARTEAMYLPGGHSYVYLIYGMHYCFNVVTRTEKQPEAVLIRALEPLKGIKVMKRHRRLEDPLKLTTGPGKLCEAMGITKENNGQSLSSASFYIEDAPRIAPRDIIAKPRVGIPYAQEALLWPLRFYIKNNLFISKK